MLYHATTTGPSIEGFQQALDFSMQLAKNNGTNQVAIAVHVKKDLYGVVRDSIGRQAVKELQKPNGTIHFNGETIFLITKLIPSNFTNGVIVAAHASTKYLNTLLLDRRATDIVYVPWAQKEMETYLKNNESTVI